MKKKRKTLFWRKIRVRKLNKRLNVKIYKSEEFLINFRFYFRKRKNLYKKRSYVSFLNKFSNINFNEIYNFLKNLGLNKNYKLQKFCHKSNLSKKLFNKFNLKVKKKKIRKRDITIFVSKHFKKFKKVKKPILIRKENIEYKKRMCLYFSYRHLLKLPVRGQRTKTNAKTRKDFNIF